MLNLIENKQYATKNIMPQTFCNVSAEEIVS